MENMIFVEDSFYIRFLCMSGAISLMFLAFVVFVQAFYSMRSSRVGELYFRVMADNVRESSNRVAADVDNLRIDSNRKNLEIKKLKLEIQKLKDANNTST